MNGLKMNRARRILLPALAACALLLASNWAQAQRGAQRRAMDDRDVLAKGNLYYSSDDITDRAAAEYREVIERYGRTAEAEAAQYLLASYFHRKFYIVREKKRENDEPAINRAEQEYKKYVENFSRAAEPKWLADSQFNLALIVLEYGHPEKALQHLNALRGAASKDPEVYIYDVVWSPHSADRVEGNYDSAQLADFTRGLIESKLSARDVVEQVREWCRGRGNSKGGY